MEYKVIEIITSYIIGILLIFLSCWLFRLKFKGAFRLVINALIGGVLLFMLNLFNIVSLPINPLNALLVGYLGIFGVILLFVLTI